MTKCRIFLLQHFFSNLPGNQGERPGNSVIYTQFCLSAAASGNSNNEFRLLSSGPHGYGSEHVGALTALLLNLTEEIHPPRLTASSGPR